MNYGLTFMARGDYPKALSEFEEALVYSPFYSSLYINMGIALTEVGEIERGRRYFLDGQRLAPGVESSYFFYGRWLASTAQYDEAVRQLKQALEINPRYREAALLLVDTYRNLNQNTEAKSLSKTMLSVLPTNAEFAAIDRSDNLADIPVFFANQKSESYYIDTMLALYNTKKFSECIALARLGLTSFKNSHLLYNNAAACALEVKNYSEAEAFASRAVELNPTFVLAQNNLRAIREQLRGSNPSSSQARALQ
jgi:tetratricopeptide (TPR) repeat protein